MLVSHCKHFIYTKTVKTAGTSIEVYFEPYCVPEGEWRFQHGHTEYESDSGIIGYRGKKNGEKRWFNHMPAATIQRQLGKAIWDEVLQILRCPKSLRQISFSLPFRRRTEESSCSRRETENPGQKPGKLHGSTSGRRTIQVMDNAGSLSNGSRCIHNRWENLHGLLHSV